MTLRTFLADTKGAYVLEFAIVAPILLLVLASILEYSLVMFANGILEDTVVSVAREESTGGMGAMATDSFTQIITFLQNQQQTSGSVLINPAKLQISSTCNGTACTPPGTAGQIVVYTVTYPYHIISPLLQGLLGSNGTLTLSASAVVMNETTGNPIIIVQ